MEVINIESSLTEGQNKRFIESRGAHLKGEHDLEAGIDVFPPGFSTGWSTHSSEQLIYVLEGKGVIGTESEQQIATPGKVFIIPRGQKHFQAATEEGDFKFLFVLAFPNTTKFEEKWMEGRRPDESH